MVGDAEGNECWCPCRCGCVAPVGSEWPWVCKDCDLGDHGSVTFDKDLVRKLIKLHASCAVKLLEILEK